MIYSDVSFTFQLPAATLAQQRETQQSIALVGPNPQNVGK